MFNLRSVLKTLFLFSQTFRILSMYWTDFIHYLKNYKLFPKKFSLFILPKLIYHLKQLYKKTTNIKNILAKAHFLKVSHKIVAITLKLASFFSGKLGFFSFFSNFKTPCKSRLKTVSIYVTATLPLQGVSVDVNVDGKSWKKLKKLEKP